MARRTPCGRQPVALRLAVLAAVVLPWSGVAAAGPASPGSSPACARSADRVPAFVAEAARRFDLPETWIRAVMQIESAGDPCAVSPAGAMGLMQIMPATWAELRARYRLGTDPFDPRDNIIAGAAYLRELHDRYGPTGMLAAYNAGPGRYEDHARRGRPLPPETLSYLSLLRPRIDPSGGRPAQPDPLAWREADLFPARLDAAAETRAETQNGRDPGAADVRADGLFVAHVGVRVPR
ncbi:lytic transglycosylase domain-containing protein [Brevundimonas diminuta]|uniref:lytic transglycosylase domain-containing protein n=1 Tax=Brevundimonas diminuta TaxID=293 RepID=UPI0019A00C13|nr:lytic transglycosylase domain-containing protein [Brevundimonas diminuta]MBD3817408.1 lytic transglycosylase domain-containing protein [Brevundimonas diminuta]